MKKQRPRPDRSLPLKWEFGPDIPTYDYIKDHHIEDMWGLQEAVDNLIHKMESGDFLAWEAVVAHEQGLPLTEKQEAALSKLLDFSDGDEERVLYIDDIPRTSEPWYVILNEIVPRLLIEPFRTFDIHDEVQCDGWKDLVRCLQVHATDLSLPANVLSPVRVVPLELRHKLWLQDCFDALSGLGQDEELTLEDPEQHDRIDDFIGCLRDYEDTVHYFGLTLDSLMERVILPEKDRLIFLRMMQERLGLKYATEQIAQHLGAEQSEQVEQRLLSQKEDWEQEEQRLLSENERLKRKIQRLASEIEDNKREIRELKAEEASLRHQYALSQEEDEGEESPLPPKKKLGRNDPCPCGSGKKFKKCCIHKQGVSFD